MLSQYRTEQLQQVVDAIIKAVSPDRLFLIGAAQHCHVDESIFTPAPVKRKEVAHYTLLVLTRQGDDRCISALQETIENQCRRLTPVTTIIEPMHLFNQWIDAGHPFAIQVSLNGLPVYDSGQSVLHMPPENFYEADYLAEQKEYARWNSQVTELMAGAELYLLRKQYGLSAFLLHQAAEHAYAILLKTVTGYQPRPHDLDKLARLCQGFSPKLANLFGNNLFQLLQKAHVNGRYRDDFAIDEKELQVLIERVKQLQAITREIIDSKLSETFVAVV